MIPQMPHDPEAEESLFSTGCRLREYCLSYNATKEHPDRLLLRDVVLGGRAVQVGEFWYTVTFCHPQGVGVVGGFAKFELRGFAVKTTAL